MKQFGIMGQDQQADMLQSLLLHVASSYDPNKANEIAQQNYALVKDQSSQDIRSRSPSLPPPKQVVDLTSLSYDELAAAETVLLECTVSTTTNKTIFRAQGNV